MLFHEGIFVHGVGKCKWTIDSVNFMNRIVTCIGEERIGILKSTWTKKLNSSRRDYIVEICGSLSMWNLWWNSRKIGKTEEVLLMVFCNVFFDWWSPSWFIKLCWSIKLCSEINRMIKYQYWVGRSPFDNGSPFGNCDFIAEKLML